MRFASSRTRCARRGRTRRSCWPRRRSPCRSSAASRCGSQGVRQLWVAVTAGVAGAAFLGMVACCVWVMLPREGGGGGFSATRLLNEYVQGDRPVPVGVMYATLALFAEERRDKTEREVGRRLRALRWASWLLAGAMTAWSASLIGG